MLHIPRCTYPVSYDGLVTVSNLHLVRLYLGDVYRPGQGEAERVAGHHSEAEDHLLVDGDPHLTPTQQGGRIDDQRIA